LRIHIRVGGNLSRFNRIHLVDQFCMTACEKYLAILFPESILNSKIVSNTCLNFCCSLAQRFFHFHIHSRTKRTMPWVSFLLHYFNLLNSFLSRELSIEDNGFLPFYEPFNTASPKAPYIFQFIIRKSKLFYAVVMV
jgi:hypothetical protein